MRSLLLLLVPGLSLGCGTAFVVGTHTSDTGFRIGDSPMRLRYADPARKTFAPGDWLVENERPQPDATLLVAKEGSDYATPVAFDTDGNGTPDDTRTLRRYEVFLRNRRSDATLSVSIFPLDQS